MTTGRINQVTILNRGGLPSQGNLARILLEEQSWLQGRGASERHPTRNCTGNTRLDRSCSTGHPIAPAEFPKRRSATVPLGPHGHHGLRHAPLRRRKPFPDHAQKRLPVRAYPQESSWGGCHRPTAHRPHRCLLGKPAGLQLTSKAKKRIV